MPKDFMSNLAIKVQTEDGQFLLSPITNINPAFNTPHTQEHSLEASNVGQTKGNDTFPFTLTCKAIRDIVSGTNPSKVMTDIQLKHKSFNVVIIEQQTSFSEGNNWAFEDSILLEGCRINTGNPSNSSLGGSPVATWSCTASKVNIDGETFDGN